MLAGRCDDINYNNILDRTKVAIRLWSHATKVVMS